MARVAERSFGLGPLEPLLRDPAVDEVMVNGVGPVWVERAGRLERTDVRFASAAELRDAIERILAPLGRRVDEAEPLCDARLPDGSRVNVVIAPLAPDGPILTVRRFRARGMSADDLVAAGTWEPPLRDLLARAVRARLSILVSGGTGSGKTTTLNALSSFVPAGERIVTIEDTLELRLRQPHVVRLEARPASVEGRGEVTIRHLVRNALRMRPDRIVVGEVRGGEALDMLAAMTTGHDGSLSTVHAGSPEEALRRLETLALMAGVGLPHAAIREQVADALDLVVHQARLPDGTRRVVAVAEVVRVARRPRHARAVRLARRAPALARGAERRAGRAPGGVMLAVALAGLAGALAVAGAWEALAAIEQAAPARVIGRWLEPLGALRREGRAPTVARAPAPGARRRRRAAGRRLAGGRSARGRGVRGGRPARRRPARARAARALAGRARARRARRGARAGRRARRRPRRARRAGGGGRGRRAGRGRAPSCARRPARSRSAPAPRTCSSACARAPARPRGTRSSPRSCSSATPAATSPACCARSPAGSRRPRAWRPTRAAPPRRRASPRGWSRCCPSARRCWPSWPTPATSSRCCARRWRRGCSGPRRVCQLVACVLISRIARVGEGW